MCSKSSRFKFYIFKFQFFKTGKRRKTHYTNAEKMAKIQEYFALAENPDLSEDERLKILNISKPTLNKWTLEWRLEGKNNVIQQK